MESDLDVTGTELERTTIKKMIEEHVGECVKCSMVMRLFKGYGTIEPRDPKILCLKGRFFAKTLCEINQKIKIKKTTGWATE